MSISAGSITRTPPSADFARLAIPLLLIAAAIAGTLWIDRGDSVPGDGAGSSSAAEVSAR